MKNEKGYTGLELATAIGCLAFMAFVVVAMVKGLMLAFQASILLGVIALFLPPTPTVIAVIAWCGHPEMCKVVAAWLKLPL
jgi:hypothetical protein